MLPVMPSAVALRKESVDRNRIIGSVFNDGVVALRKESVDRNTHTTTTTATVLPSLSARRAWIEILQAIPDRWLLFVALRKESVDRNRKSYNDGIWLRWSLSARRAWIEIH